MDVFSAFEYVFEDHKWFRKVVVGGIVSLLSLALVGLPLLAGYDTETLGNLLNGRRDPLPSWSSWRKLYVRGLGALAIVLVYLLPVLIVTAGSVLVTLRSTAQGQVETFRTIAALFYITYGLVSVVCFMPLGWARYAASGQLSAAFDFREMLFLVASRSGAFVQTLIWLALVQVIAMSGLLVAGIGYPFTFFWGRLVQAHLLAQFMRGEENLAVGASDRGSWRPAPPA